MARRGADIISFHTDGELPPVVLFQTWAAEGAHLAVLADHLGPAQPLYGVLPPSIDAPLPDSVADWLAYHRRHLESLALDPPYRLAGFSFGGVIALEMTRQLRAEGIEVAWTGLIDTTRPKLNPRGWRYVPYHLREIRDLPDRESRRKYIRKHLRGGVHRTKVRSKIRAYRILSALHLVRPRPRPQTLGDASDMSALKRSIWRSYLSYDPDPFDGPVVLFSGTESRADAAGDVNLRWSRYLPRLTTIPVDGPHKGLFSPEHAASIVNAVAASLAAANDRSAAARR